VFSWSANDVFYAIVWTLWLCWSRKALVGHVTLRSQMKVGTVSCEWCQHCQVCTGSYAGIGGWLFCI